MKQNKKKEFNLCWRYRKGLQSTQMKHTKSTQDLEKEASKTYNNKVL